MRLGLDGYSTSGVVTRPLAGPLLLARKIISEFYATDTCCNATFSELAGKNPLQNYYRSVFGVRSQGEGNLSRDPEFVSLLL